MVAHCFRGTALILPSIIYALYTSTEACVPFGRVCWYICTSLGDRDRNESLLQPAAGVDPRGLGVQLGRRLREHVVRLERLRDRGRRQRLHFRTNADISPRGTPLSCNAAACHHAVSFRPNWGSPLATPHPDLLVMQLSFKEISSEVLCAFFLKATRNYEPHRLSHAAYRPSHVAEVNAVKRATLRGALRVTQTSIWSPSPFRSITP